MRDGHNDGSNIPNDMCETVTQEIHVISSDSRHHERSDAKGQPFQQQFEPMTFSNTPFPAEKDGHHISKADAAPQCFPWSSACLSTVLHLTLSEE